MIRDHPVGARRGAALVTAVSLALVVAASILEPRHLERGRIEAEDEPDSGN